MAVLDWIFLVALLLSFGLGLWRGMVYEVLSLLAWAAAFFAAQWFADDAAILLPLAGFPQPARYAAGFAAVFVAAVFTGGLLAWLVKHLVAAIGLRPVDRLLGGIFGLLRGLVLLLAVAIVVEMTPLSSQQDWQEATGAQALRVLLRGLGPLLPEELQKYLP
ncbi:MAG: CvpA family protein [Burkholderiaceae bacterium]